MEDTERYETGTAILKSITEKAGSLKAELERQLAEITSNLSKEEAELKKLEEVKNAEEALEKVLECVSLITPSLRPPLQNQQIFIQR